MDDDNPANKKNQKRYGESYPVAGRFAVDPNKRDPTGTTRQF
jgi:hypothetical protein